MQEQQQPQMPLPVAQPIWKDLLIPASIIIAGAAIGIGLYFSAGSSAPTQVVGAAGQPQEVDRTGEVTAVTDADHRKGPADAQVTIVEYSDFDCPFCSRFHDAMNQIVASNDNVAWVYRQFPLVQLHPNAPTVAQASECMAELGGQAAFWTFTDGYFAARGAQDATPNETLFAQLAAKAGVDAAALTECVTSGRTESLVQADADNAVATGGQGTPWSVVIGPTGKTYPINGALPKAAVEQVIQIALDEA